MFSLVWFDMLLLRARSTERAHRLWSQKQLAELEPPEHLTACGPFWASVSTFVKLGEYVLFCRIIRVIGTQIGSYRPCFRFINWLQFSKPLIGQKRHISWGLWSVWTRPITAWCWTLIWGWILEDCLASQSSLLFVPHYAEAKASFWARGFRDHVCIWGSINRDYNVIAQIISHGSRLRIV